MSEQDNKIPGPPPVPSELLGARAPSLAVEVVTASQHAALVLRSELLGAREEALKLREEAAALREKVAETKFTKSRIAEIVAYTIAIVNGLGAIGAAAAYAIAQIVQAYAQASGGHR